MPLQQIIDRAYQIEAVKTIAEQIEAAYRRFLLVLATGTGKTRVAIALVELLQRHERIQRVLFLADRRELVKQALGAFKEHLPGTPRAWIESGAPFIISAAQSSAVCISSSRGTTSLTRPYCVACCAVIRFEARIIPMAR